MSANRKTRLLHKHQAIRAEYNRLCALNKYTYIYRLELLEKKFFLSVNYLEKVICKTDDDAIYQTGQLKMFDNDSNETKDA